MKAVYLLFVTLENRKKIEIGALGTIEFEPGTYVYTGSAMNSVEKRIERHCSKNKNSHWHIDYLTLEADRFDYFILPETSEYECIMSNILSDFCEPVPEFGASDCGCSTHLYRIPENFSH